MEFCIFSKHLQELDYKKLSSAIKELGIDGVDLTVRKGGHIEPCQVKEKLPEVYEIFQKEVKKISMVTSDITDINQPYARDVIEVAGGLGIQYLKLGYYMSSEFGSIKKIIIEAKVKMKEIVSFCKEKKIKVVYHNHSGDFLGNNLSHIAEIIEECPEAWIGFYFDIGHATIEGVRSGWKTSLDYFSDRIFIIAVKDLIFEKVNNKGDYPFQTKIVPLGQGFVDWTSFCKCLKIINYNGVLSFHSEYKEWSVQQVIEQTKKDLEFFHKTFKESEQKGIAKVL